MSNYIREFNTQTDYHESLKTSDGSSVNLIANSSVIFEGVNTFVTVPDKGDAVVYGSDKKVYFIKKDTVDILQLTDAGYTPVGVVVKNYGNGKVLIIHKNSRSYPFSAVAIWKLSGSALTDNQSHSDNLLFVSGSTTVYSASFNWQTSTAEEFVGAFNTFLENHHPDGINYSCYIEEQPDNTIVIQQNDFTSVLIVPRFLNSTLECTFNVAPELPIASEAFKYNGIGKAGGIYNLGRALSYFRDDLSTPTYNPPTPSAAVSNMYPICLPGYLGTSAYVSGDPCATLRSTYGEGVEGWTKYMESCRLVVPNFSENSIFGHTTTPGGDLIDLTDGHRLSYILKGKTYLNTNTGERALLYPAIEFATSAGYDDVPGLETGKWFMPSMAQLIELSESSTYPYPTSNRRFADDINRTLVAIGSDTGISNSSYAWSSIRYGTNSIWRIFTTGIISAGQFCTSQPVHRCLIYDLHSNE